MYIRMLCIVIFNSVTLVVVIKIFT